MRLLLPLRDVKKKKERIVNFTKLVKKRSPFLVRRILGFQSLLNAKNLEEIVASCKPACCCLFLHASRDGA